MSTEFYTAGKTGVMGIEKEKVERPNDPCEHLQWMKDICGVEVAGNYANYYESVATAVQGNLEKSAFWQELISNMATYDQEYLAQTGEYKLLFDAKPLKILIKPYDSFLSKVYRKNILENRNWPDSQPEGWILPDNWFFRINDIVRTSISVKYLDGVEFLIRKLCDLCDSRKKRCDISYEAKEEGYYAVHFYIIDTFEIPRMNWDTQKCDFQIEIQITTQLQEVIRKLLHKYYEKKRIESKVPDKKWQWDYRSEEFSVNYLGHILHYVEGMIMEIRKKTNKKELVK